MSHFRPSQRNIIKTNILDAIRRMRRDGVTGCSLDCLFQNTRTYGVDLPISRYRDEFDSVALSLSFSPFHFHIYQDHDHESLRTHLP